MTRLSKNIRVLVADGQKALVLKNVGDAITPELRLVRSYDQENPPTRAQGADRPGRSFDSTSNQRSAIEAPDLHRIAEEKFIAMLAQIMAQDLANGEFEALIVAAPPLALGAYRNAVSKPVAAITKAEIAKDFTKHSMADILQLISKALEAA